MVMEMGDGVQKKIEAEILLLWLFLLIQQQEVDLTKNLRKSNSLKSKFQDLV